MDELVAVFGSFPVSGKTRPWPVPLFDKFHNSAHTRQQQCRRNMNPSRCRPGSCRKGNELQLPYFQGAGGACGMAPDITVNSASGVICNKADHSSFSMCSFSSKGHALGFARLTCFCFSGCYPHVVATVVCFEFITWNTCTCALCTQTSGARVCHRHMNRAE